MFHCPLHKTQVVSKPQSKLKLLKSRHESEDGYSILEPVVRTPKKKPSKFDEIPTPKYTAVKYKIRVDDRPADEVNKVMSYLEKSPRNYHGPESMVQPTRFKKREVRVEADQEHKKQIREMLDRIRMD